MEEKALRDLLIKYDELYRMAMYPIWRETRRDNDASGDFDFFEKTYDLFKKERAIAIAQAGIEHYEKVIKDNS